MCTGPLKKICHWGPLTALGIIKIITLMTIHCSRQWWPPQESFWAAANFCLFFFLSGSTLFHFISAIFEGPGFLPLKWMPDKATDVQFLQYCTVCQGYKAPRSHHCRKCDRCVMKMDHHCPWINNCVGHFNHGHFTTFLASAVGGCFVSTIILISWVVTVLSLKPISFPPPSVLTLVLVVFTIGLSIGVVLTVGMLLYFQMTAILKNRTEIEDWILEKAHYRRLGTDEKFIHPYSKGWLFNMKQVLTWDCSPVGDGIHWPVIDDCDQYTLTREQLAQKMDKRKRARRYRIIEPASGSWLPIRYGFSVLCHPPYTDEARIKLDVGDTVIVTRWRRYQDILFPLYRPWFHLHLPSTLCTYNATGGNFVITNKYINYCRYWLFGEKEQEILSDTPVKRVRGWFPRPCAIELIENNRYSSASPKSE